jgi:hypothetical protein
MGCEVYANNMSIACKAADGKTIAAFPDVCFTPPLTPATPPGVPIPYPNTAMASDTTDGSKTVMISGQEVMLKDKSVFKTSTGDEAGSAPKKGVVTSQIKGKVNFTSWSMDVKFEGENVPRHLDMTLHNEASLPANTPVWPYLDQMAISLDHPCVGDMKKEYAACKDYKPHNPDGADACPPTPPGGKPATDPEALSYAAQVRQNACLTTRRCSLQPYKKTEKGKGGCCDGQTGHHLIEASAFYSSGRGPASPLFNCSRYNEAEAPAICVEGTNHGVGTHGLMHTFQSASAMSCPEGALAASGTMFSHRRTTVATAQKSGAAAVTDTFPDSGCNEKCLEAQLSAYHEDHCKMTDPTQIKAVATCEPDEARLEAAHDTVKGFSGGAGAE